MRAYDRLIEQDIRTERLAREWARSGLLEPAQLEQVLKGLKIDVRRTNTFLRLVLYVFTVLIYIALALLTQIPFNFVRGGTAAGIWLGFAVLAVIVAEVLVGFFKLYRFGIEEASAMVAVLFAAIAAWAIVDSRGTAGLTVAAVAACLVYFRFGFTYAAITSMLCVAAIPFQFGWADSTSRLVAAAFLAGVWFVAKTARRPIGDEFPGDELVFIEAVAWVSIYAFLNLNLFRVIGSAFFYQVVSEPAFYWFTYVMIWLLPAAGFYLSTRSKERAMLDVNIAMALATLVTNKPYLHGVQNPWDPVIFGLLLVGVALVIRRWLEKPGTEKRTGFTASRLLDSERRRAELVGSLAGMVRPSMPQTANTPPDNFRGGGGRSGGAGASGSF